MVSYWSKDFEAMNARKLAIPPWLSCPYNRIWSWTFHLPWLYPLFLDLPLSKSQILCFIEKFSISVIENNFLWVKKGFEFAVLTLISYLSNNTVKQEPSVGRLCDSNFYFVTTWWRNPPNSNLVRATALQLSCPLKQKRRKPPSKFNRAWVLGWKEQKEKKSAWHPMILLRKGPFLYYVRVFWGFFEPPTHLRKNIFTT